MLGWYRILIMQSLSINYVLKMLIVVHFSLFRQCVSLIQTIIHEKQNFWVVYFLSLSVIFWMLFRLYDTRHHKKMMLNVSMLPLCFKLKKYIRMLSKVQSNKKKYNTTWKFCLKLLSRTICRHTDAMSFRIQRGSLEQFPFDQCTDCRIHVSESVGNLNSHILSKLSSDLAQFIYL